MLVQPTIYWTMFKYNDTQFTLATTDEGLCFTGALNKDESELLEWAKKCFKGSEVIEDAEKVAPYVQMFNEYFAGERTQFDLPIYYRGTAFQERIWQVLQDIPYGETCSYSDIAQRIGNPKAVRAVGGAIGANPVMIVVPCHRVIGKNGSLTGFRGGLELKKLLLTIEGIK
ncbi:methylated-DNA--[protein]-cysteine S-methyltransferase [Solibacillus sp. CAU 1738]|uniref:methylated-DNA--[protein]-cysteine S-methyltransferase n=1 Tax=Solibacillus sp. CAU 1738 TaxID=3140363 RepID=UPI003260ADAD